MKTIGIIGGASDVATVEYYKLINAGVKARLGGHHTAEIILNSMDFGEVERLVNGNLWDEGENYVNSHAKALARAGVDFILCVSNTWHRINFMKDVATPLLHIVDPTAKAILAAGLNKILLLGTKSTMSVMWMREMYTERFGVETMVPSNEDQNYINGVIFNELTQNRFRDESRRNYLSIIKKACQEGAQGVILGCTEIGLLVKQLDCPEIPLFDPLKLHADAAVEMALSDGPNPQRN